MKQGKLMLAMLTLAAGMYVNADTTQSVPFFLASGQRKDATTATFSASTARVASKAQKARAVKSKVAAQPKAVVAKVAPAAARAPRRNAATRSWLQAIKQKVQPAVQQ